MKIAFALILVLSIGGAVRAGEPKRLAVPDAAALAEIEKTIKSVFAPDYAKKAAADQVEFAAKLLKEAADTTDNPAGKFVLLREAQSLAARGGDFELAARAGAELASNFKIDGVKSRWEFLEAVAAGPSSPGKSGAAAQFFLTAAIDAMQSDDYESAANILKLAASSARTAKNTALATAFGDRAKTVSAIEDEYKRIKPDVDAWKAKGGGSEQIGRFLCFFQGNWPKGLPMLAKSSDSAIQAMALKDLENPKASAAQLAVADGWWSIAAAQPKSMQPAIKNRARYWYQKAAGDLAGLSKARADANSAAAEKLAFDRMPASSQTGQPATTAKTPEKAGFIPKDSQKKYVFLFQSGPNAKTGVQRIFEPQGKGKWEMRTEQINLDDKSFVRMMDGKPIPYVEVPGPRNETNLRATIGTGVYKITPEGLFTYRDDRGDWYQYPGSGEWVPK